MERYEKDGIHVDSYSWDEFILACRENRDYPVDSTASLCCAADERSSAWNGAVTHLQACNLAEFGWPDGREYMQSVDFDIDPQAKDFVVENEQRIYDVCGAIPDVPRAIAGDPCAMIEIERTESPSKIIPILIDITTPAMTDTESIKRRGGAVVSWLDHLENKGWSVELTVRFSGCNDFRGKEVFCQHVVVKQAGEPMDIDRLLFMMAHPAGLRRLMFHLQDLQPGTVALSSCRGVFNDRTLDEFTFVPALRHRISDSDQATSELKDIMTSKL